MMEDLQHRLILQKLNKQNIVNNFFNTDYCETLESSKTLADLQTSGATAVAFDLDNKKIAIGFVNNKVEIRNLEQPKTPTHTVNFFDPVDLLAFTPWEECKELIMQQKPSTRSPKLRSWNTTTNIDDLDSQNLTSIDITNSVNNLTFIPNQIAFLTLDQEGKITTCAKKDPAREWEKIDTTEYTKLPNEQQIISPLRNYVGTFNPQVPKVAFFPIKNNESQTTQAIQITTGRQLIDHIAYSWDGETVAIVIKADQTCGEGFIVLDNKGSFIRAYDAFNEKISLWNPRTGTLIKKLDVPNIQNLKSVTLNKNAIALLFNDGELKLLTFEDPTKQDILKTLEQKPLLKELIYKAIIATHDKSSHTMSDEEYKEFTKESSEHQEFLMKNLDLRLSIFKKFTNMLVRNKAKIFALLALYALWELWSLTHK